MPSELHLTTRKTVSISYLVQAVGARCDRLLPQPQKTLTAFPSGHRCLRHPKVKVFALKGSPNVPHVANIATVYPNLCRISLRRSDRRL